MKYKSNQKGIAQIFILLALIAAIGLGAYLVQQQTNTTPHAEYTSADGGDCRDNPRLAPTPDEKFMSEADRPLYDYYWKADCSRTCVDFDRSTDCPASDLGADNTRWCYGFKDAGYCLKLQIVKQGTTQDVSSSDRFKASSGKIPTTNYTPGTGAGGKITSAAQQQACTAATSTAYFDAKVANRVTRYMAILKGIPGYCVQADLGLEPALKDIAAKTVEGDPAGAKGRLLLCSGTTKADGNKPDLVWRVALDTDPGKLREVASENGLPDKRNLPNFQQALDKSGISRPSDL